MVDERTGRERDKKGPWVQGRVSGRERKLKVGREFNWGLELFCCWYANWGLLIGKKATQLVLKLGWIVKNLTMNICRNHE
jgi:hypothetical protein